METGFQDQIFNAINIITEEKMKSLSFNYCIEGIVISSKQNVDGSYYFSYQETVLTAFPIDNTLYKKGDIIYVMAINGDLNKKKIILSAKNKSGQQYVDIKKELLKVNKAGINYVTNVESEFVLYSGTSEKALTISPNIISDSMTETFIRVSADIQTILTPTVGGDYGIALTLKYNDGQIKTYELSLNDVLGNSYNNNRRQSTITELYLDSNMKEVVSAKIFIKDFPIEDYPNKYVKFTNVRIEYVDEYSVDISNQVNYNLEIFSTNGIAFKNGVIGTTLMAKVYRGSDDITDKIDQSRFSWNKTLSDGTEIANWKTGSSTITITKDDVVERATFSCIIN